MACTRTRARKITGQPAQIVSLAFDTPQRKSALPSPPVPSPPNPTFTAAPDTKPMEAEVELDDGDRDPVSVSCPSHRLGHGKKSLTL
jgi:hypothetical protein